MSSLAALSRFVRPARRPPKVNGPVCELCAAPAGAEHGHVVDLQAHAIRCACTTCERLFAQPAAGGRFRTVPARVLSDGAKGPSAAEWAALGIPVHLAFLYRSSRAGRWVAAYPGPAGTVEGELSQEALARLDVLPLARLVEPDVEALLFHAERGEATLECLLVPIDACYALAGRLRRTWRGLDGGDAARAELREALAALRARARSAAPPPLQRSWGGGRGEGQEGSP